MSPALTPDLDVTHLNIPIADLSPKLEGLRIAHISDLHVGPEPWNPMHLEEAAGAVRAFDPDLVLNTGDYLQGDPPIARVADAACQFLLSGGRLTEGPRNIAVLGNHDYYAGPEMLGLLKSSLMDVGICLLVNDLTCVALNGRPLTIAGLSGEEEGFDEALRLLAAAPKPRIVLLHEPDLAQRLPSRIGDLVLAGHTHGGQITLPWLTGLIVRHFCGSRYTESFYRINDNPMYINRGLGCTGLPIRFRAAPEVTLMRLVR